jgi:hypothetical protein
VEYKTFLTEIGKAVHGELVVDNLATHKTPAIKAWLARHRRVHIHFKPPGSPPSAASASRAGHRSSTTQHKLPTEESLGCSSTVAGKGGVAYRQL